jgi:thiamine kinase-like enzyme
MESEKNKIIKDLVKKVFAEDYQEQKTRKLGGLTNHNYLISIRSGNFVVRLPGKGTEEMINRSHEHISSNLANELDIDAKLIYFDDKTGIKISRFIEGAVTMTAETLSTDENLILVVETLIKLHTSGKNTGIEFNAMKMIEEYESLLKTNQGKFYEDYNSIKEKVLQYYQEIYRNNFVSVPCHNDPLCENWIKGNDRIYLIDWEYAGMNDAIWDLSDVSIEACLTWEKDRFLLNLYLGHDAGNDEIRRFLINKVFLDFLWSLWGKLRGLYEDDMEEYAHTRYVRAKKNIVILEGGI